MRPKLNHVIFLGAGASYSSGYPIGQELRLLMTSRDYFQAKLDKLYPTDNSIQKQSLYESKLKCLEYFDSFSNSMEFFRRGGFATVDEFSKLATEGFPEHVQAMKKLMCFVLAMHNPEEKFHESDYYPFIQRLFRSDTLNQFRDEITIITFNYDCYLDFVMREAYRHRLAISKSAKVVKTLTEYLNNSPDLAEPWSNKLSSGFYHQESDKAVAWGAGQFNYYKLHGSITYGGAPANFGYDKLFLQGAPIRFQFLEDQWFVKHFVPPVVFPWELFDKDSGKFISEDDFVYVKGKCAMFGSDGKKLFNHFKTMWENAKISVERADKISFVGLSIHDYLEGGLRYLLQDVGKIKDPKVRACITEGTYDEAKPKRVEVVVANPDNNQFKNAENRLHPSSLCGKVADLLKRVAPNLAYVRSSSEDDGIFRSTDTPDKVEDPDITPRLTFREFIEREMD